MILLGLMAAAWTVMAQEPKREFRGAWLNTIYRGEYAKMSAEECKKYLSLQLDKLHSAGVNAVFFQVRPQADAFYPSELEPWSRFLSKDGRAPKPYWDPLEFMVEEAHARGMELHAWINPYRVSTSKKQRLPKGHIYHRHPERFVRYADGLIYFDPGIPETENGLWKWCLTLPRVTISTGCIFDDYFYPYPVAGKDFPDAASYKKYGKKKTRPHGAARMWISSSPTSTAPCGNRRKKASLHRIRRKPLRNMAQQGFRPAWLGNFRVAKLRRPLCRRTTVGPRRVDRLSGATALLAARPRPRAGT